MIVQTTSGKISGVPLQGAYVFRGIPYAAPPTGKRRFQPPAPPQPWPGVRKCDHFGPLAPQQTDPSGGTTRIQSEDCLYLNVWTRGCEKEPMPVLVYIHGGGFVSGTGADCDGLRHAAEDGIVYVSINYRLGALGFLYLGEVLGEAYAASGNNGLLDIAAALQWVQRNISAFGGDPARVTVIGNSAGAKCTASLYAMEAARSLFHRAVTQSGATQAIRDRRTANVTTLRILEELGLSGADPSPLLELPFEQLIAAQSAVGSDTSRSLHMFGPVADGRVIPLDPLASIAASSGLPPLLIGTNENEASIFIRDDSTLQSPGMELLDRFFGSHAPAVWDAYQHYAEAMSPPDAWCTTLTEHLYTIGALQFAQALASSGTQVWMYRLRAGSALGATHGYEGSLIHWDPETQPSVALATGDPYAVPAEQYPLARSMREAWVAFIRSGDPNIDALPAWPVYGKKSAIMVLDTASRVADDLPEPAGIGVPHQVWRVDR
ncbi:carboxylesterase family protein [Paenibacillus cellulositrophicus]|uniref:carboxylesterase/lipase family protein n=1 Tax=Paenibacillus cellulositrophicus TaxID=562959 RepID=UPI002040A570|nr:carboxylesterase family protein [Paenibacillus cellulositrophicus]MCM2999818.1 carboxylesterase family protein [Paenibacillus cellulositrophicus]